MKPYKCTKCGKVIMGLGYIMVHLDQHNVEEKNMKHTKKGIKR